MNSLALLGTDLISSEATTMRPSSVFLWRSIVLTMLFFLVACQGPDKPGAAKSAPSRKAKKTAAKPVPAREQPPQAAKPYPAPEEAGLPKLTYSPVHDAE